MFRQLKELSEA